MTFKRFRVFMMAMRVPGIANRALAEFHTDGAGVHALALIYRTPRGGTGQIFAVIPRYQLLFGIVLGLQQLGLHARDRAGATGAVTVVAKPLLAVASRLADQIANAFGKPELKLITHDGEITSALRDDDWRFGLDDWLD